MKEMFLTKEGTLTESIKQVYISEDKQYYHSNASIVKIYENLKIKDFDKLISKTYIYKEQIFEYPEINCYNNTIIYNLKDNSDVYLEFYFDSGFTSIDNLKPHFFHWDRTCELYIELSEYDIENYLY